MHVPVDVERVARQNHPTRAAAVPALHQHVRATGMCAPLCQLVDEAAGAGPPVVEALQHVRRAAEDCPHEHLLRSAWYPENGVRLLLDALHEHDGRHNVSPETRDRVRTALEKAVQAAWLVHRPTASAAAVECPAHEAATPADVRRPMIDPIFVGDESQGIDARGCLVGLKPFSTGRCARWRWAPTSTACSARWHATRAASTSALLSRRHSQGRRHRAVGEGARRYKRGGRRRLWHTRRQDCGLPRPARGVDANVSYLAPVFAEVRPPLPRERRMRGKHGTAWGMQQYATEQRMEQQQVTDTEAWARRV